MTFQEIRIIATGPCIANQLREVNTRFAEFLPLIYPPELEVNETTDTASSATILDLYLEFDDSGQPSNNIYDKRDDLNFKIINFSDKMLNDVISKPRLLNPYLDTFSIFTL
jgi:hypothetical protein